MLKKWPWKGHLITLEVTQKNILLFLTILLIIAAFSINSNAAEPAKAGPKYLNLRYDEDFSYLGDPTASYESAPWDSVKWIKLNDDWHLTLGGQVALLKRQVTMMYQI